MRPRDRADLRRFPRTRGDRPVLRISRRDRERWFPRTRGDRPYARDRADRTGFPRTRGDRPVAGNCKIYFSRFPRTRGDRPVLWMAGR